jgi:pimeloyl-ACP methyl ester carboxylesterase
VPDFANPQNLNRFSYVDNRPLKYVDPSGHVGVCLSGSPLPAPPPADSAIGQLCDELQEKDIIEGKRRLTSNVPDVIEGELVGFIKDELAKAEAENRQETVTILGYSWGGTGALELAALLDEEGIAVDNLILIDPYYGPRNTRTAELPWNNTYPETPDEIPDNVKRALNLSATRSGWQLVGAEKPTSVKIPVIGEYSFRPHVNIPLGGRNWYENAVNMRMSTEHGLIMNIAHNRGGPEVVNPRTKQYIINFFSQ